MSVYYLEGQSNYGDSAGLTGYFYPLYTDASLISGVYHTHTFVGLDDVVFYMPMGEMNHAVSTAPSVSSYNGSAYQEYATYGLNDEGLVTYTNISAPAVKQVVSVAAYSPGAKASPRTRVTNVESSRVEDLIPMQLRESSETLIALLSDYYNYLNQQDQTSDIFNRIVSEQDIDETSLGYLDKLQNEIAKTVPDSKTLDKVSLYKRIVKYYSIRGSEESVLVFFRIFFDELVEVMYPKDFLLKPSSGKWKTNDKIQNYIDFIQGYVDKTENFNEQNLNDTVSFRDINNLQIATGQIRRVENINTAETHPVTDNHIIELSADDSTLYDNTNPDEPTFKLNNPAAGGPAQATALLKNGVTYTPTEGLDLSASSGGGGGGFERAHVDLGQVYSSENITETTDAFSMVARVKASSFYGAVASIFNGSSTFPSHVMYLNSNKLAAEIWRWGSFYGYNANYTKGSTSLPTNEWCTVATRGKRDSAATPAAGGSGYVDVSVNGESWERVWDDSDYGTPTSFNINKFFTTTDTVYSLSNFQEDGTKNGKPKYTTAISNLSKTGSGRGNIYLDAYAATNNVTKFEIYFENDLTSSPLNQSGIETDQGVYGAWILRPADGNVPASSSAFAVWYDIDSTVEMSEISTIPGAIVGIAGQIPTSAINTTIFPVATPIGNGDFGGHGPNDSGSARNNFYDVLKDYNRQLRNADNDYIQRKPWLNYQMIFGFLYISSGAAIEFVSNDKKLTWVTTKDFLDVKDKSGHLRLGVHRYNHYYSGKILHFSYFNKVVSQSELDDIHEYYTSFNLNKWGLRVSVNEDASVINAKDIVRLADNAYTLKDITGPKINAFWTYDEDKFGSVLTGFKVAGSSGTINWGDGSVPITYADNIATQHTFGPSSALQGRYENRKGFLSDIDKMQDSNYWQDYSYEIRSGLPNNEWINEYLRLVHPAGMKLFAALLLQIVHKNIWTGSKYYNENNPQEEEQLKSWLEKLTPPSRRSDVNENGYHLPFYQPGWLSSESRSLMLLIQALVFSGEDARSGGDKFERAIKLIIKFTTELNAKTRDRHVLEQHQGAQKFFDIKTRVADYSYLTSNELGNDEIKLSPSQSYESNILADRLPWSLGTGNDDVYGTTSSSRWGASGSTLENNRTYRNDPFGKLNIAWIAKDLNSLSSGGSDWDGGVMNSPVIDIDASENKTYRFSVWVKQQKDYTTGEMVPAPSLPTRASGFILSGAESFPGEGSPNGTYTYSGLQRLYSGARTGPYETYVGPNGHKFILAESYASATHINGQVINGRIDYQLWRFIGPDMSVGQSNSNDFVNSARYVTEAVDNITTHPLFNTAVFPEGKEVWEVDWTDQSVEGTASGLYSDAEVFGNNPDALENAVFTTTATVPETFTTVDGEGDIIFAMNARDTSGDIHADDSVLNASNDAVDEFPHFRSRFDLPTNDTWYLLVGFLRPEDNTTTTVLSDSFGGIYDTSGNRVNTTIDEYKYLSDVNGLGIRAFTYGNTRNIGDEVEMWGPRIDVVDGNEPSVQALIFPTIDSDILYGIKSRPSSQVVYKLNNFSTEVLGFVTPSDVHSIVTNDINYGNQLNYNENLKFIDTTNIGSYYDVAISDMANVEESGYVTQDLNEKVGRFDSGGTNQSGGGY